MQIYYFSGAGNTLFVARELQRRMEGTELGPIVGAIKRGKLKAEAESVGILFPIHAFSIPVYIEEFLAKLDLSSASYIFALATRECSDKVFSDIDGIIAPQGKSLSASFAVEMPCSYIPIFTIPKESVIEKMESRLQQRLDEIQGVIARKEASRIKDSPLVYLLGHVLYPPITDWYRNRRFVDMQASYFADDRCQGCGTCERVCLTGRIRLEDRRPTWRDSRCAHCFACLHWCPSEAIQIRKRNTEKKSRYHHARIEAGAIAQQKDLPTTKGQV
jgi:ferredoxin